MFDPSIKKENLIVIEDNSEDSKEGIKEQEKIPPVHRKEKENKNLEKTEGKGKQVAQYSTGPTKRETTRSSKVEALFKGIGGISDDKDYHPVDSDQIPDILEAMYSNSYDDDHSSKLYSRY
jgi:hypothetical protein